VNKRYRNGRQYCDEQFPPVPGFELEKKRVLDYLPHIGVIQHLPTPTYKIIYKYDNFIGDGKH